MKQGGDTNTIQVVNGIRDMIGKLFDIPKQLEADGGVRSIRAFVKEAIQTLLHEGLIGLVLTSLMILIFLGSLRATVAVFLVDSAFRPGHVRDPVPDGQHRQHHDSGRTGAGVLARDR